MAIVNTNWLPTYEEFQEKAKAGFVTLNPTSEELTWLEGIINVRKRYWFFDEPNYLVRVLNMMIHKDHMFDDIVSKGIDIVLHDERQDYVIEAFRNLNKYSPV